MARASSVAAVQTLAPAASLSRSIWAKMDHASATTMTTSVSTQADQRQHELDTYLSVKSVDRDQCPLCWWMGNKALFPGLDSVAKKMLAVPATSVASERLFCDVITKKRNQLSASKADQVCFLMKNTSYVFHIKGSSDRP